MKVATMLVADPKVHKPTKIKAPRYSFWGNLGSTVSLALNSYNNSGLTSNVDQEMANVMISERMEFLILSVLVLICKREISRGERRAQHQTYTAEAKESGSTFHT